MKTKVSAREASDVILEKLTGLDRGDEISTEEILEACGLRDKSDNPLLVCAVQGRVRTALLKTRGIDLLLHHPGGWKLCTIEEQILDNPDMRVRRAKRQVRRANSSATALAVADTPLTMHQRRLLDMTIEELEKAEKAQRKIVLPKSKSIHEISR